MSTTQVGPIDPTEHTEPTDPEATPDAPAFTSSRPLDYVPGVLLLIGVGLLGK